MLKIFNYIPITSYIMLVYFLVAYIPSLGLEFWSREMLNFTMLSQTSFRLSWGGAFIISSLIALYIEISFSARSATNAIVNHVISLLLFIMGFALFLMVDKAATLEFLILVIIMLIDVAAGLTLSIRSAKSASSMNDLS